MAGPVSGKGISRNKPLLFAVLVVLCAALALCWVIGSRYEKNRLPREAEIPMTAEEMDQQFPLLALTRADQETDSSSVQNLDLSSFDKECIILEGGAYRLTGSLNGVVRVAAEEQTVHLILDNAIVTAPQGPALLVESAGKVILTLPEGTRSSFSDSGHYPNGTGEEACVSSHSDLTVNGSGALTVNGLYKDAVRSKNVIRIAGGEITIKCKRTGIHAADGILVAGGKLNISSEKNGLKTTKSGADGRGNVVISGGEHRFIAGRHAFLVGRGDLYIYHCLIYDKSIVSTCSVGGKTRIQSGCIQ